MMNLYTCAALLLLRTSGVLSDVAAVPDAVARLNDASAYTADDRGQVNRGSGGYVHLRDSATRRRRSKRPRQRTTDDGDASASSFGTALFSEVCTKSTGNVFISPLSVYKALVLVKDGATLGSNNEAELERVLGPPSTIEQTEGDGDGDSNGVILSMASSIWTDNLRESYVEKVEEEHSAEAYPLPSRYTDINEWIEDNTNGMIRGFLGDGKISPHVVALLVNVIYFKVKWTYEFDLEKTEDGEFNLRDGSTTPARFMTATRKMQYNGDTYELGWASAVLLDYGEESSEPSEFTSLFILPESADAESMDAVISGLKNQPISDILDTTFETTVVLRLPRFRLEFGPAELKPALEAMGINDAFSEHIDGKFDEMSYDPSLFVEDVLHGAVIEVTEEGTEAAGTTVVPIRNRSMPRPPPELTFDRPFVVAVVHRTTGTPLFIGRVEEPDLDF